MPDAAYRMGRLHALRKLGMVDRRVDVTKSHLEAKNDDWPTEQRYEFPHTRATGQELSVDQAWGSHDAIGPRESPRQTPHTEYIG